MALLLVMLLGNGITALVQEDQECRYLR